MYDSAEQYLCMWKDACISAKWQWQKHQTGKLSYNRVPHQENVTHHIAYTRVKAQTLEERWYGINYKTYLMAKFGLR